MSSDLKVLKRALKDEKLESLDCICPEETSHLVKILEKLPNSAYVSEWRYGLGAVHYEYHVHTNGVVPALKGALKRGLTGGHPKLTHIYSKRELQKLVKEFSVGSEY